MVKYGFYNAVNHDRVYSSTEFGEMFDGLINDGVYSTILNAFAVTPGSGIQVRVDTGRAWFNKTWTVNTSLLPVTLADPDLLLPRIDAIVLQIDKRASTRMNSIIVVTGTPASSPAKPTLTRSESLSLFQYPLAWVTVRANASSIAKSDIDNCVGRTPTPFATGMMQQISIDAAFLQWEGQWEEWFDGIKLSLGENAATELLARIVNLETRATNLEKNTLNASTKATTAEAVAGTNDAHWMTPAKTKDYVDGQVATNSYIDAWTASTVSGKLVTPGGLGNLASANFVLLTTTSSSTWTVPTKYKNKLAIVVLLGAGGGGGGGGGGNNVTTQGGYSAIPYGGYGGGSGAPGVLRVVAIRLTETSYTYQCGVGGAGGSGTAANNSAYGSTRAGEGSNGGDTIFGSITATGGSGGTGGFTGDAGTISLTNPEQVYKDSTHIGVGGVRPVSATQASSTTNTNILALCERGNDGTPPSRTNYNSNANGAIYYTGGSGGAAVVGLAGVTNYGGGGSGGKGGDSYIPVGSSGPATAITAKAGSSGTKGQNGYIQIIIIRP